MGIRRWVKLTVFTYSEVCLINYFHLEVFFWDCVLAVIPLFEQIDFCRSLTKIHKLIRESYFYFDYMWHSKRKTSRWTDLETLSFHSMYWKVVAPAKWEEWWCMEKLYSVRLLYLREIFSHVAGKLSHYRGLQIPLFLIKMWWILS